MEDKNQADFLSIKEFSVLIHVHPNTVRRSIKNGRLNAFRIGTGQKAVYRIPRTEIHRLAFLNLEEMVTAILQNKSASQ